MRIVGNTAFGFVLAALGLYVLLIQIETFGPILLPSEIFVWFIDSRIELCKRESVVLELFLCKGDRGQMGPVMFFRLALVAAAFAYAGWTIAKEWRSRTAGQFFKSIILPATATGVFFVLLWFGINAWSSGLHQFSTDDMAGIWEPKYQGSVVSLTLKADGQYFYKVITKQNGTFENTNLWKVVVLEPGEIPEFPPESKILEFSSFQFRDEFDKCETQQPPCEPPGEAVGFVSRSVLGQMKIGVVNDAGIVSFRKVK